MEAMYSMSLISVKGKLTARFYLDGKPYKSKNLGITCDTSDINNPNVALDAILSDYRQAFKNACWKCSLNGGNPYNLMFGTNTGMTFTSLFKGTNFFEYVGGEISWSEITSQKLYEYKDYLELDGYAPNTIKKYLNDCKFRLDKARACGVDFPSNDYNRILKGKKGTTTSIYLTVDELKLLEKVDVFSPEEEAVRTLSLLSAYTGARFSDVIGLDLANIEGVNEGVNRFELTYVSQKTTIPTRVPLKPIVRELLGKTLGKVSNDKANTILPELCRRAGISGDVKVFKCDKLHTGEKWEFVRTHTMRKSFATNVYLSGMYDLRSISKMMGHALIETTSSTYIICGVKELGYEFNYFE